MNLSNGHANGVNGVKNVTLKRPYLKQTPNSKQLIVNDEPFLMLAGELQNSSLTSAKYMRSVWQKMIDTNINTLLGCVTWEMIEPVEGEFDFVEFDNVIEDARSYSTHLVLLWFGSFKNGQQNPRGLVIFITWSSHTLEATIRCRHSNGSILSRMKMKEVAWFVYGLLGLVPT
jgi:Beta-galactosidase